MHEYYGGGIAQLANGGTADPSFWSRFWRAPSPSPVQQGSGFRQFGRQMLPQLFPMAGAFASGISSLRGSPSQGEGTAMQKNWGRRAVEGMYGPAVGGIADLFTPSSRGSWRESSPSERFQKISPILSAAMPYGGGFLSRGISSALETPAGPRRIGRGIGNFLGGLTSAILPGSGMLVDRLRNRFQERRGLGGLQPIEVRAKKINPDDPRGRSGGVRQPRSQTEGLRDWQAGNVGIGSKLAKRAAQRAASSGMGWAGPSTASLAAMRMNQAVDDSGLQYESRLEAAMERRLKRQELKDALLSAEEARKPTSVAEDALFDAALAGVAGVDRKGVMQRGSLPMNERILAAISSPAQGRYNGNGIGGLRHG